VAKVRWPREIRVDLGTGVVRVVQHQDFDFWVPLARELQTAFESMSVETTEAVGQEAPISPASSVAGVAAGQEGFGPPTRRSFGVDVTGAEFEFDEEIADYPVSDSVSRYPWYQAARDNNWPVDTGQSSELLQAAVRFFTERTGSDVHFAIQRPAGFDFEYMEEIEWMGKLDPETGQFVNAITPDGDTAPLKPTFAIRREVLGTWNDLLRNAYGDLTTRANNRL